MFFQIQSNKQFTIITDLSLISRNKCVYKDCLQDSESNLITLPQTLE